MTAEDQAKLNSISQRVREERWERLARRWMERHGKTPLKEDKGFMWVGLHDNFESGVHYVLPLSIFLDLANIRFTQYRHALYVSEREAVVDIGRVLESLQKWLEC